MRDQASSWQIFDGQGRRKYLTSGERTRFIERAADLSPDRRALCLLLAFTGCRVSEALGLHRHQIDAERSAVIFRTLKRRKLVFRSVPIPRALCALLLSLPSVEDGRLWTMHRTTAWRLVQRIAQPLQIAGPMACPKGLRHAFGIHAATKNIPPNLIQRWMGHATTKTTAIYLDAVGAEEIAFAKRMWN